MSTTSTSGTREAMAQANGIPVENKNSGDQLLKNTLTFDLDPELYDSWCNIGTILNLTADSQIMAFLINFYLEQYSWMAKKNCETCGAELTLNCLHCLAQHSPQLVESSITDQKTHLQKELRAAYLLDKCEGDKNRADSKSIAETNQNVVASGTPSNKKVDLACQDASNIDSDGGVKTSVQDHAKRKPLTIFLQKKKLLWPENRRKKSPKMLQIANVLYSPPSQQLPGYGQSLQNLVPTVPLSKASDCFPSLEAAESDVVSMKIPKGSPPEQQMKMSPPKKTASSSFAELQTTEGMMDQINDNTPNDNDVGEFEPNPGKLKQINSDLGPIPRTQNCIERLVEIQQKLKQEKVDSQVKSEADNSLRLYKIIGLVKKGDIFSAPTLETVHVKTPENNFDDTPIQGQLKNSGKFIYILNKNVAPVPNVHSQSQAASNTDCLQGSRISLPVTSISHMEEDSDDSFQNASIDVNPVTDSDGGDETLDSSFPELQTTDGVTDQIHDNTSDNFAARQPKKVSSEKSNADVLPRLYKIIGILKKSDSTSAPDLEAADVKPIIDNFDDAPIQGQSNNPLKMIDPLNKNVTAPLLEGHLQGQANNISGAGCKQGLRIQSSIKKTYVCPFCSKIYKSASAFNSHKKEHMGDVACCSICNKKYSSVYNMMYHQKVVHQGLKPFKCDQCDKHFTHKNKLNQHILSHGNSICCSICNKKYSSVYNMTYHQKIVHQGIKPFKCDLCDKHYSHKYKLKRHMLLHGDATPHSCFCGKAFKTKAQFKCHSITVHSSRDHVCKVCGKAFKLVKVLEGHIKHVHEGLQRRRHACEFCGRTFADRKCLKLHRWRHTGEPRPKIVPKRVACETCGKTFLLTSIKRHRRTHTGEKPYFCAVCGKSFATEKHKRIHSVCKKL